MQRGLKDWCVVSQLPGHVGEGRLRNRVLGAQVVVERGPIWAIEIVWQIVWAGAILIAWPEVDPCFPLCLNPSHVAQLSIDFRAPGGTESTLLAPGLSTLAAAFGIGSMVPTQGLAAHVIADCLPADVHVDVMVREVLCAAGTVHTALPTKVQGERGTAGTVEGAFCVHTLTILTDHVLAFVVILALPAGGIVVVARAAQANVARDCVEAPAILAESRPEQHTLIGVCVHGLSKSPGSFHGDVALTTGAELTEFS